MKNHLNQKSIKKQNINFPWVTLWLANTLGAFLILMVVKAALLLNLISLEGQKNIYYHTIGKTIFCLGWDVVGAAIIGAIAVLGLRKLRFALFAAPIHLIHSGFLVVSYYVNRAVGSPLDKTALDIAFLGSSQTSSPIWESIFLYLSLTSFAFLAMAMAISVGSVWMATRLLPGLGQYFKRGILVGMATMLLLTIIVSTYFRNGEVYNINIETYALERSPFVYFLSSYLKPPIRRLFLKKYNFPNQFCFDHNSLAQKKPLKNNPLIISDTDSSKRKHSNLLLIVLESVAQPYLKQTPKNTHPMPNLQRLWQEGSSVYFNSHYSTWPLSMKSLFSILCSESPHPDYYPIPYLNPGIPCPSLFEVLKEQNFNTALFSSVDLNFVWMINFFKFRKYDLIRDMYTMPGREKAWSNRWGIDEEATIKAMFQWVDGLDLSKENFAITYIIATGHHPYSFPGAPKFIPSDIAQEKKAYYRCLNYIDQKIAQVETMLKKRNLLENTMLVLVSDHGEGFDRRLNAKCHGNNVYDEAVHIPLVIKGPQLAGVRKQVNFPTSHIDIAPTVLGLMGIPVPGAMKGRDLTRSRQPKIVFFGSRPPASMFGLLDQPWKFILTQESDFRELYDTSVDPDEKNNLAIAHPDLVKKYYQKLKLWQAHSRNLVENYAQLSHQQNNTCYKNSKKPKPISANDYRSTPPTGVKSPQPPEGQF